MVQLYKGNVKVKLSDNVLLILRKSIDGKECKIYWDVTVSLTTPKLSWDLFQ